MKYHILLSLLKIQWGEAAKMLLIIASAATLIVSITLLVLEIIGKNKDHVVFVAQNAEPMEASPEAVPVAAVADAPTEETPPEIVSALTDTTDESKEAFLVDGKLIYIMYERSFTAKLIQAPDELKEKYSDLKGELLSYGVKPRMSWGNESFYTGRQTVVKFAIRGKTLIIYLAIDPAEYENTKYIYENAGDTKRYASTPMRIKLRSARAVKWTKELIAILMAKLGLEKREIEAVDYRPEYETTEALVERGLIKVYTNGDGTETEVTAADYAALRQEKFYRINKAASSEQKTTVETVEEAVAAPVAVAEEPEEQVTEELVEKIEEAPAEISAEAVEEVAEEIPEAATEAEAAAEPEAEPEIEAEEVTIEQAISSIEEDSALETVIDQLLVDAENESVGRSYILLSSLGTPIVKRKKLGEKYSDFVFADGADDGTAILVPYTRAQYLALPRKKKKSVLMMVRRLLAYQEMSALLAALKSRNSENPRILERIAALEDKISGLGKSISTAPLWAESVKRVKKY